MQDSGLFPHEKTEMTDTKLERDNDVKFKNTEKSEGHHRTSGL